MERRLERAGDAEVAFQLGVLLHIEFRIRWHGPVSAHDGAFGCPAEVKLAGGWAGVPILDSLNVAPNARVTDDERAPLGCRRDFERNGVGARVDLAIEGIPVGRG